jgi:hypothetical protein
MRRWRYKSHRKWREGWYLILSGVFMIAYLEVIQYVTGNGYLDGGPVDCTDVLSNGTELLRAAGRHLLAADPKEPKKDPLFPSDIFTQQQLKKGKERWKTR